MSKKEKTAKKKRLANWCLKCAKEHENMGIEICPECGGKVDICYGPPDLSGSISQTERIVPF